MHDSLTATERRTLTAERVFWSRGQGTPRLVPRLGGNLGGSSDQRGEIRTVADLGPDPCMIGTAELPGYLAS